MKLIPVISRRPGGRRARRLPPLVTITASLALLVPLSFAAPALAGSQATNPSCPWLNQSLPISQRVHLLLSKMTLANEITMVEGQGTTQPYVFYMAAQPSLCIPAMGLEDGPLGVGDGICQCAGSAC